MPNHTIMFSHIQLCQIGLEYNACGVPFSKQNQPLISALRDGFVQTIQLVGHLQDKPQPKNIHTGSSK